MAYPLPVFFPPTERLPAGYHYFQASDSGLEASDLRNEVGGKAAGMLHLDKHPNFEEFKNLLNGLHPHTGEQLTAKLVDNRISYWDVTASIPKGVTTALERGDTRIHEALWEAGRETMADLEAYITTRERKNGAHKNRTTGNMIWYGFEHPETRPAKENNLPDPDRHIHFVVPNVTYDHNEDQWKAIKFRPIMDMRKWFDRRFDMRLAHKLSNLGYEIETRYKTDGKAKRYYSWDIKGMPQSVITKFSRRTAEVEKLAAELKVETPTGKDKLGATSRQHKRDDMTLEDYRAYWNSRITPDEAQKIVEVIKTAMQGRNPKQQNTADKGIAYAIAHQFERNSVVNYHDLAITAMERCMGGATPEEIEPEARKQGVLIRSSEATTKEVLAEEGRIIDFARDGRGTMRPMGGERLPAGRLPPGVASGADPRTDHATLHGFGQQKGRPDESRRPHGSGVGARPDHHATLSAEQQAMVSHVLKSTNQVILVIGDAGTGKTRSIKSAFQAIDRPIEIIAPSSDASRKVLREEGFSKADTVASFLGSTERQAAVRNGVIWIDEAGMLPIRDLSQLIDIAKRQNARLVLQGDPKQHKSPARHGNMMNVLQEYADLPVGRLTEIWRQEHKGYKAAVASIAKGDISGGYDKLNALGWVKQTGLVDDYMEALRTKKPKQKDHERVIVVAPTHKEGDAITGEIRKRLKEAGRLGEERTVECLVPLNWTEAENGDPSRYDGTEVVQFFRNSGPYRAGQRVEAVDLQPANPKHFAVYHRATLGIAPGETIRITAGGKTKDGHRLENGSVYTVKAFRDGDIVLNNDWVVGSDFKHMTHGYVSTSHASQGKTVDRILIAMGNDSRPAINAEQFYVSVSRGRERACIYTGLSPKTLRDAIQRSDNRKSATEVFKPRRKSLARIIKDRYRILEQKAKRMLETVRQKEREMAHAR